MTDAQKMERNKKNVVEFYNAVLNEKDFDKAATYVGATYIQHNPIGADGLDGIKGFIDFLRDKFPNNKSEIKRVFADGNYVIVHVHAVREPGHASAATRSSICSGSTTTARCWSTGTRCSRSRIRKRR